MSDQQQGQYQTPEREKSELFFQNNPHQKFNRGQIHPRLSQPPKIWITLEKGQFFAWKQRG